jgi:hypothetical protein
MRPTGKRFTVRWMMAAVAAVAVLLFAVVQLDRFRKLGISYRRMAAELEQEEAYTRRNIRRTEAVIADVRARLELADVKGEPRLRNLLDEQRGQMARYVDYARCVAELRSKCEKAADAPWIPFKPDLLPYRP